MEVEECMAEETPIFMAAKKQTAREETGGNISFNGTPIVTCLHLLGFLIAHVVMISSIDKVAYS